MYLREPTFRQQHPSILQDGQGELLHPFTLAVYLSPAGLDEDVIATYYLKKGLIAEWDASTQGLGFPDTTVPL